MATKCNNCGMLNQTNARYCSGCGYEISKPVQPVLDISQLKQEYMVRKTRNKRRNLIAGFIGLVFLGLVAIGVYIFSAGKGYQQKFLEYSATQYDKTCPVMIAPDVRLEGVEVLPEKVIHYRYTLLNVLKEEVNVDTLAMKATPEIVANIKSAPDLRLYRNLGATFSYTYNDRLGIFIWKLDVTPEMYK